MLDLKNTSEPTPAPVAKGFWEQLFESVKLHPYTGEDEDDFDPNLPCEKDVDT